MSYQGNRRHFLKQGIGAGLCAAAWLRPALGQSPNGKIHHAAIGVGGKGWTDIMELASHPQVVIAALCDVDAAHLRQAGQKFPQARCYQDWRELLAEEGYSVMKEDEDGEMVEQTFFGKDFEKLSEVYKEEGEEGALEKLRLMAPKDMVCTDPNDKKRAGGVPRKNRMRELPPDIRVG